MCVMEENKQKLEFIEPEVKVVEISGQGRLCEASFEAEAKTLESYEKIYF